jgi:hypothetical protein
MLIFKLYNKQIEVGEIKFKDDEKFLLACKFAQRWKDKSKKNNNFSISFENKKMPEKY